MEGRFPMAKSKLTIFEKTNDIFLQGEFQSELNIPQYWREDELFTTLYI